MSGELQQSATNAIGEKASAVIASVFSAILGNAEGIETAIRVISALPLAVLSCVLVYGQIKKGRAERKLLYLQIEVLESKNEKEGES